MPFLLSESGPFRMKALNKLTGNDILDKVVQSFNKDALSVNKTIKIKKEDFDDKQKEYNKLKNEREIKAKLLEKINKCFVDLNERYINYEKIKEITYKIHQHKQKLIEIKDQLSNIKLIDDKDITNLDNKIESFVSVNRIYTDVNRKKIILFAIKSDLKSIVIPEIDVKKYLTKTENYGIISILYNNIIKKRKELSDISKNLDHFKIPDNINLLESKINNYINLVEMLTKLTDKNDCKSGLIKEIEEIDKDIKFEEKNYKDKLKELKICPVCTQPITDKCLKEIKL